MLIAKITCSRASFSIRAEVYLKKGVFYGLIGPSAEPAKIHKHGVPGKSPLPTFNS